MLKTLVITVILLDENNKILMEKHRINKEMQNLWQFPGGKVESNELLKTAVIREIQEELGIDINIDNLVPLSFEDYKKNNNEHFIIFYFICKNWKGTIFNKENQTLKWFSLDEIKISEIIPYNHRVMRQLVNFLEK